MRLGCFHTRTYSCLLVIGSPKTHVNAWCKQGQCDVCIDCYKYNVLLVIYIFCVFFDWFALCINHIAYLAWSKNNQTCVCVCTFIESKLEFWIWSWSSVSRPWVCQRHSVQHLIQKLQSTVQVNLHPAGCVFDALPGVVGPPPLHEAEPQDTQAPQVINTNPCCCRQTCQWRRDWNEKWQHLMVLTIKAMFHHSA